MIAATPSRTAFRVALRRAAHQIADDEPLVFRDPYAPRILGPDAQHYLQHIPDGERKPFSSSMRAWMVARARLAEDVLHGQAAKETTTQYLVLGAGLDTFALRNPHAHVAIFEVDHPATQAWKRDLLHQATLSEQHRAAFVPVDFELQSLAEELTAAGFRFDLATTVAWLGVVPYLTADAFTNTCRTLGRLAPGSQVVFDYGQPREVLSPVEQLMHDSLASRVAQAGEPFQLFFTPATLKQELLHYGLQVQEDFGSTDLNQRYFQSRTDGLATRGSGGRLCRATTATNKAACT